MKIQQATYLTSVVDTTLIPNQDLPQFLLIGRSNVGKSSFINCLTNRKHLAYTSSKPGKTQTLNFYLCDNKFMLVDSPGYGYSVNAKTERVAHGKLLERYLESKVNLKHVFLIIDSRRTIPTEDDLLVYQFLKNYSFPITIICTKIDKLTKNELHKYMTSIKSYFLNDSLVFFSSLTRVGRDEILKIMEDEIN